MTLVAGIASNVRMKLTVERPLACPEAAARELLRIYRNRLKGAAPYTYTGVTNYDFTDAGGSVAEYAAGRDYGIARKWFRAGDCGIGSFRLEAPGWVFNPNGSEPVAHNSFSKVNGEDAT